MTAKTIALPPIDPAAPATIGGFLAEVAGKFGPREALVLYDDLQGGARVSWTYADLLARAQDVARGLIAMGVGKGERVGILLGNRPDFAAALFGTTMAGAVPVTFSTLSTNDELATLLGCSDVSVLLTQRAIARRDLAADIDALVADALPLAGGDFLSERFPYLRRIAVLAQERDAARLQSWDGFVAAGQAIPLSQVERRMAAVQPSEPGMIIYTSGTTSEPKGVIHRHSTVVKQFRWQSFIYGRDADTRIWSPFPLFWSAGVVSVLGSTLALGGAWVGQEIFEPGEGLKLIAREKVTEPYGFPTHTAALADHPDWPTADLSSLTRVQGNNEFASHPNTSPDPNWNMIVAYGMSETCTSMVSHLSTTPVAEQAKSMGLPLPGIEVRIVDFETGEPLAIGGNGEICVRGPTVMEHYVGIAREDCFDADGYFHSGDTGFVDEEGYLHWTGRIKNMVKTGGANVAAGEVEDVAASLGTLKLCRVIGMPDARLGEMVVLCAVPEEGAAPTEEAVRAAMREKLAGYKVPKRVLFFSIEDYPLTASGKVKVDELRALVSERMGASETA